MIALTASMILGVAALLGFNYSNSIHTIYDETYRATENSLTLYRTQLEKDMRNMGVYLTEYITDNKDISTIIHNQRHTTEWGAAVYRIQKRLSSAQAIYPADGFFLFVPETNTTICSASHKEVFTENIQDSIRNGDWERAENKGKWIHLAGTGYLYRAVQIFGCYIGTWIEGERFLNNLCEGTPSAEYYWCSEEGQLLGSDAVVDSGILPGKNQDAYGFVDIGGTRYMAIAQKVKFSNLYLLNLIPQDEIQKGVHVYLPVMLASILAALFGFSLFARGLGRWLIAPLNRLTEAIRQLQEGNWETAVEEEQSCTEFMMVSQAFNQMTSKVRGLKISVYEEQLSRQKVELEYLKWQITPHFLINCLNTIYQLTDMSYPELAQQMAQELSLYIRYTLSRGSLVTLGDELKNVENYVRLSNIRYHDAIKLLVSIDSSFFECQVVPFLILNFVENTIKHEVRIGQTIYIHVSAEAVIEREKEWLAFSIWDTGKGFPPDFLDRFQNIEEYVEQTDSHLGIRNVYKRARMLLGECQFRFTNRPGAGAQIDILIPNTKLAAKEGNRDEFADRR